MVQGLPRSAPIAFSTMIADREARIELSLRWVSGPHAELTARKAALKSENFPSFLLATSNARASISTDHNFADETVPVIGEELTPRGLDGGRPGTFSSGASLFSFQIKNPCFGTCFP
jgi:hypothetical protein